MTDGDKLYIYVELDKIKKLLSVLYEEYDQIEIIINELLAIDKMTSNAGEVSQHLEFAYGERNNILNRINLLKDIISDFEKLLYSIKDDFYYLNKML